MKSVFGIVQKLESKHIKNLEKFFQKHLYLKHVSKQVKDVIKNIHLKTIPSNKTSALTKSINIEI